MKSGRAGIGDDEFRLNVSVTVRRNGAEGRTSRAFGGVGQAEAQTDPAFGTAIDSCNFPIFQPREAVPLLHLHVVRTKEK